MKSEYIWIFLDKDPNKKQLLRLEVQKKSSCTIGMDIFHFNFINPYTKRLMSHTNGANKKLFNTKFEALMYFSENERDITNILKYKKKFPEVFI